MINRNLPSSLVLAPAACSEVCDCEDPLWFRGKSASLWWQSHCGLQKHFTAHIAYQAGK